MINRIFKVIFLFHFIFAQIISFFLLKFFSYKLVKIALKFYPFSVRYLILNQSKLLIILDHWNLNYSINCLTSTLVISEILDRINIVHDVNWSVSGPLLSFSAHAWIQLKCGFKIGEDIKLIQLRKKNEY